MKTLWKSICQQASLRCQAIVDELRIRKKIEKCYCWVTDLRISFESCYRNETKPSSSAMANFGRTRPSLFTAIFVTAVLGLCSWPVSAANAPEAVVRIGLTATFPNDQYRIIEEWRLYLEQKLQRQVEFVRRDSYMETMELLRLKKLDYAWICDYPFVNSGSRTRLLAVPLYQKRPYYRSYLIVSATNSTATSIEHLRNKMFAYTDPYSNTGYLTPRYQLRKMGEDPARFFRQTFFTWSHRKAIEAVATGVADGAAVSNHVWETLAIVKPELTAATRIIWKSPEYGFAPFVAHSSVPESQFRAMQSALLDMTTDAQGAKLLLGLNLDGFIAGDSNLYNEVRQMIRVVDDK